MQINTDFFSKISLFHLHFIYLFIFFIYIYFFQSSHMCVSALHSLAEEEMKFGECAY